MKENWEGRLAFERMQMWRYQQGSWKCRILIQNRYELNAMNYGIKCTNVTAEVLRMNKTVVATTSDRKQKREKTAKASFFQIIVGMQKISAKTLHWVLRGGA